MNILIVGGGGREDALAWKIAQSPRVERLYCAPGNPGAARYAKCVEIDVNDHASLAAFAREHDIGLTVVGPEDPLANGIVDRFIEEGLKVFGPSREAAQLEASKTFAKDLMAGYGIPTGAHKVFTTADEAIRYVREQALPLVIKADGLAAGKGVTVAFDQEQAVEAINACMVNRRFGGAGDTVVIEEYLEGEEASIFALTDGTHVLSFVSSQDHKPLNDGDSGPNTGGMGAYSPAPVITEALHREIEDRITLPCIRAMTSEDRPYKGVLYAGLMITSEGPKVVEFNCRFGDPETQVLLPRMQSDLVPLLEACCDGGLGRHVIDWRDGACITVVMTAGGYPGAYEKGKVIKGTEKAESLDDVMVFHAGTRQQNGELVTNGGRVLNVTAVGSTVADAIDRVYGAVECIHFEGAHYRNDIGQKALARMSRKPD